MRAIFHIAGECRDLGDDPGVWVPHFARGTAALVGGDYAAIWQVAGLADRAITVHGLNEWEWENGFDRDGWAKSVAEFQGDPFFTPEYERYFARLATTTGCASPGPT